MLLFPTCSLTRNIDAFCAGVKFGGARIAGGRKSGFNNAQVETQRGGVRSAQRAASALKRIRAQLPINRSIPLDIRPLIC
jgi:hypothetical protein